MNKAILIFIVSLFLISSCTQKTPKNIECNTDNDCAIAGCSSQLCLEKDKADGAITTCEYRAEYECLKETSCSCINYKCEWEENQEYLACLEELR